MSVPDWAPASDGETVVWEGQPRKRVVHQGIAVGVAAALVITAVTYVVASNGWLPAAAVTAVGVPFALAAFGLFAGGAWLWRWATRYVLTDAALYHRTGVLSLTVTELRLGKIQNTSYSQGVFGSIFDHGTVTVDTAGSRGAELTLRQLDGPQAVHQRIAERAGGAGDDTADAVPGSLAQWQSVRAEVSRLRTAVVGDR